MKILVLGSGGREHALCWKMAQSPLVDKVFCAPGNAGTALEGKVENVAIPISDKEALLRFATEQGVALTVVGPEQPLVDGIVDFFEENQRPIFGPRASAARLEGSKAFAKEVMRASGVPTAQCEIFDGYEQAQAYLKAAIYPLVLKADGLAAGKGVRVCQTQAEADEFLDDLMGQRAFGAAGARVVIEDCLVGQELSVIGLCNDQDYLLFSPARDHKALLDGNAGPNTGGMGAYTPVQGVSTDDLHLVGESVFKPVLAHLASSGEPFKGFLYAGLMLTDAGPQVLEFNVRLGDPETQPLLYHLKSDLVPYLKAVADGQFLKTPLQWHSGYSLCVVLTSPGYPGSYERHLPLPEACSQSMIDDCKLFHAGTAQGQGGRLVTSGGRVLSLTNRATSLKEAQQQLYGALPKVSFRGVHFRKDIGSQ